MLIISSMIVLKISSVLHSGRVVPAVMSVGLVNHGPAKVYKHVQ